MNQKISSLLLLASCLSLTLLVSVSAKAEPPFYLSVGYQKAQIDSNGTTLEGAGWYLDGQYPLSDKLALVGRFGRIDYELMEMTDWQLGGRFQQSLLEVAAIGLEYRYIDLSAEVGGISVGEAVHQGGIDLTIAFGSSETTSKQGALELGAALSSYKSEDRERFSVGYRSYLSGGFSLALHLHQESDDLRWVTLSLREEK